VTKPPESDPRPEALPADDNASASPGPLAHSIAGHPVHFQFPLPGIGASAGVLLNQPAFPPSSQFVVQQVQTWQSPYPPPEHIKEYEAVLPGTFDRILKMAEQGQAAQIESVRTAQRNLLADSQRGNYLGFIITAAAMGCAMACVAYGAMWIAGLFLSVPVMSVGRALIESAKSRRAVRLRPERMDHATLHVRLVTCESGEIRCRTLTYASPGRSKPGSLTR
jgi:uncharacterized membrane protein